MNVSQISNEYFKLNPSNEVDSLNDIDVPFQKEEKPLVDENVTDFTHSELIRRVFENKAMSLITKQSRSVMAKGGETKDDKPKQEVWTPYDFLHTKLKEVYGRDYVISDEKAKVLYQEIETEQTALDVEIESLTKEHKVESIFQLPIEVFEKIDERRKALEEKRMFISHGELEAYVLTNPDLEAKNYVKKTTRSREDLIEEGLIMLDLTGDDLRWVYKYDYLGGNIQKKISDMSLKSELYKSHMTDDQFKRQMDALHDSSNPLARITKEGKNKIFIHPNSDFAQKKDEFKIVPEDWRYIDNVTREVSLAEGFKIYLRSDEVGKEEFRYVQSSGEVIKYYIEGQKPNTGDGRSDVNLKQNAQLDGEVLFEKFLNEGLNEKCKQRLEAVWNAKYNNLALPKMYKIPVALSLSKTFKDGSVFTPNPTQIQSVQFMRNSGSGLLAYGVGVGKTASSIMNVSYALDNGLSKKPLFVVPNSTYEKWVMEIQGGYKTFYQVAYEKEGAEKRQIFNNKKDATAFKKENGGKIHEVTKYVEGLLPHTPQIVPLFNLNEKIVRYELKDYTKDEQEELANMDTLRTYLSSLNPQSDLGSSTITNRIKELYDDFEYDNIVKDYNIYMSDFQIQWGATKPKKTGKPKTLFEFFKDSVQSYIRELPYKLGTIKPFADNSIFVVTYEGIARLGVESIFSDERHTINQDDSMFGIMYNELSQGESIQDIRGRNGNKEADLLEDAYFGGVGNPKIFLADLGIDYAVYDESHNFKKVFTKSKGKPQTSRGSYDRTTAKGTVYREPRKYELGKGGYPSVRALSAFCSVRYIQMKNEGRNVCHLTATPFTNEPIEVYSMLALTNYPLLKAAGYEHIEDFYDVFMRISYDIRYTASQQISKEEVLVGYNNAPQMRHLIFFLMDYKNGDDANIKRPDKFLMPSYENSIDTIVPAHPEQVVAFNLIKDYIKGKKSMEEICDIVQDDIDVSNMSDAELIDIIVKGGTSAQVDKWEILSGETLNDKARQDAEKVAARIIEKEQAEAYEGSEEKDNAIIRVLKGLSFMKQVTLSPYLFSCRKAGGNEPTAKEYVESSPKLLYAVNCIKSIHDYEKENKPYASNSKVPQLSGAVMYMNIGVDPTVAVKRGDETIKMKWSEGGFEKIRKYFVEELGYNESQISIVKGGMSIANKEKEKNKFLAGDSIVLIGSSTISTGVDLQNNASALFSLAYDWNPTDNEQVNGRIHRQGNRFGTVRIVYPMIENSADPIIFQLLQEKTLRIKEIWDKDGKTSALDLRDFNPSEFKKKLITDPVDRAKYWFEENSKELEDERNTLQNKRDSLRDASNDYDTLVNYRFPMKALLTIIDHFRKEQKRKVAVEEQKSKIEKITTEHMSDPETLVKELKKVNEGQYDHQKDPEGRYQPENYNDINDDELYRLVLSRVTNYESWYHKNNTYETNVALNTFTNEFYPQYYKGEWKETDELNRLKKEIDNAKEAYDQANEVFKKLDREQDEIMSEHGWVKESYEKDPAYITSENKLRNAINKRQELRDKGTALEKELRNATGGMKVQFDKWTGIGQKALDWKNAKRLFDKHLERLQIMGVEADNIDAAKQMMTDRIAEITSEIETLEAKIPEMIEKFELEAEEARSIAPTVSERVGEFAAYNPHFLTLEASLPTFEDDEATVAHKVSKAKPKAEPKMSEEEFLRNKIEAFEMMLEMEDDKEEIEFLKDKIEAFEMMLEMEEV